MIKTGSKEQNTIMKKLIKKLDTPYKEKAF